MLEIRNSVGRGRGVFATADISAGQIIHVDHSRELTPADLVLFDLTSVSGHWFEHPVKTGYGLLPIGYSGLVNHSDDPNAVLSWQQSEIGCTGSLISLKNIGKNDEIFIDYGVDTPSDWC